MNIKFRKVKKCSTTHKSMFNSEKDAGRAMMRTWSHDTKMDVFQYHTYICPDCKSWHFGNKVMYEKYVKPTENKNANQIQSV